MWSGNFSTHDRTFFTIDGSDRRTEFAHRYAGQRPWPVATPPSSLREDLPMIDTLFDLLGMFYQRGEFGRAERLALNILRSIPEDPVAMQFLGLVYYRTRRRCEAIAAFDVADGAVDGPLLQFRGDQTLCASAQCLRAASRSGSTLAGAWYELGLVQLRLRRYPQAIRAWQAALSARPDCPAVQRAIARLVRSACQRRSGVAGQLAVGAADRPPVPSVIGPDPATWQVCRRLATGRGMVGSRLPTRPDCRSCKPRREGGCPGAVERLAERGAVPAGTLVNHRGGSCE